MIYLLIAGMFIVFGAIYTIHLNTVPDETIKMQMKGFVLFLEAAPHKWELSQFYPIYNAGDGTIIAVRFNLWNHIRYCLFYWKVIREKTQLRQKELVIKFAYDFYDEKQINAEQKDSENLL